MNTPVTHKREGIARQLGAEYQGRDPAMDRDV